MGLEGHNTLSKRPKISRTIINYSFTNPCAHFHRSIIEREKKMFSENLVNNLLKLLCFHQVLSLFFLKLDETNWARDIQHLKCGSLQRSKMNTNVLTEIYSILWQLHFLPTCSWEFNFISLEIWISRCCTCEFLFSSIFLPLSTRDSPTFYQIVTKVLNLSENSCHSTV